jgi:Cu+-exporting ATPase
MTLLVNAAGVGLIVLILWYFFFSRRGEAGETRGDEGLQRISVRVKGGYIPEIVVAKPDIPLEIAFVREEDSPCSEEIVFPTLGIKSVLPAFRTTTVRIPPSAEGRYPFTCGMNMLHGTLVVGESEAPRTSGASHEEDAAIDPVCGMRVARSRSAWTSLKGGTTVHFCGPDCKRRFDQASSTATN